MNYLKKMKWAFATLVGSIFFVNAVQAQSFYNDYLKYLKAQTKGNERSPKSIYSSFQSQFTTKIRKLFVEVKRKTHYDMLRCDKLYIFQATTDFYNGGYYMLFWNGEHSCYYEIDQSSPFRNYKNAQLKTIIDARDKMKILIPDLKEYIESADSLAFRKYFLSPDIPDIGHIDGVKFTVATKVKGHWIFFTSQSFLLVRPG